MKNNRRWKDMLLGGVLAVAVSCAVVPALAYSGTRTANLLYDNIKVELDGTRLTLRDGKGKVVEPFVIDGTTYLPVRAVAESMGLEVSWDSKTSTVQLFSDDDSVGKYIGEKKAKSIALAHAGVSSRDVVFLEVTMDWDNGRMEYEVEFYSGSREYDYEIDALTGEILSYDYDAESYTPSQSGTVISESRAKAIARERAGISGGTFTEFKLDYDDGRAVYEGELRNGSVEYDFELDALTGTVLEWSAD